MNKKLEFSLTPVSGTLKERGGFRAKFGKNANRVLGIDEVLEEAQADGAFFGVDSGLMKVFLQGILKSMITHTAADGVTRRIDDYLSVSLKIHGSFDSADEDFDSQKHKLALSLKPLSAFRPKFNLKPVNVNHKRQFRIYSVTAADGSRGNLEVVWGQDFCINGASLLQDYERFFVSCQMRDPSGVPKGSYMCTNPEIVSATDRQILCHWPEDFTEEFNHGRMYVSVSKNNSEILPDELFPDRVKAVTVYPA